MGQRFPLRVTGNRSVRAAVQGGRLIEEAAMTGIRRVRSGFLVLAALTALVVPAAAVGDHGGGGGGGGRAPPPPLPPAGAPAVAFTPTSLTFAAQAIGTTSAPQSITVANTGNAPLFINSAATRGANPHDFTEVSDGCSGLTLAV